MFTRSRSQFSFALPTITFVLMALLVSAQLGVAQGVPTPVDQVQQAQQVSTQQSAAGQPKPYPVQGSTPAAQHQHQHQAQATQAPQAAHAQGRPVARIAASPNQQIVIELNNLLSTQAARGQFPSNNAFLADVQRLIQKYSGVPKSKIQVTNLGPGVLKVTFASGTFIDVQPNFRIDLDVGKPQIQLEGKFQNVLISLENLATGPANFWDQDDRAHHVLKASSSGRFVQPHRATLTPGTFGHHLEQ